MSKTLTFNPEFFKRILSAHEKLITQGQTVIIGFSGGPDSLLLLYFFVWLQKEYSLTIIAAHLDHGWRERSAQDALFCQKVAEQLGVTCIVGKGAEIIVEKSFNGSQEEEGRHKRRAFFEYIAAAHPNACIALGHHQDDQHETFFIRLMRGTGITGLAGIKPRDCLYIHPLLSCTKHEIVSWLTEHELPFLIDESNQSEEYLRNRIRLNVIPALRACDDRFDESLTRTMKNLREVDDFVKQVTQQQHDYCSYLHNGSRYLDVQKLFEQHALLQKHILLDWIIEHGVRVTPSERFFDEVMRFLKNSKGLTHTFYASWSIVKKGQYIYIQKKLV